MMNFSDRSASTTLVGRAKATYVSSSLFMIAIAIANPPLIDLALRPLLGPRWLSNPLNIRMV